MTQYAEVTNNIVTRLISRPRWFDDEGNPVSDEVLVQHGRYPVIDEPPEYDATTQWVERKPFEEWIVEADVVRATYTVHDRDPAEVAAALVREIDAERDRRIAAGFTFAGKLYQGRPEDRENISGAALAALAAQMAGATPGDLRWHGGDSDFVWIAADNSLTPMDAQTMFAFGQAAMAHKQAHIFAARALKDAVPIPADYADDAYWPATGE